MGARETTLRDLGGLMLEMYKRNRFREELLLDKCEEVLAIEVEIAHVDQRLFQMAPPNAAGMRPIGRCECGAPIHPGQNFCGVCGRSFATLTQARSCMRCGTALRQGDHYCSTCGSEAPDMLQVLDAPPGASSFTAGSSGEDATSLAASAVAQTVVIDLPPTASMTTQDRTPTPTAVPDQDATPSAPIVDSSSHLTPPPLEEVAPSPDVDPAPAAPEPTIGPAPETGTPAAAATTPDIDVFSPEAPPAPPVFDTPPPVIDIDQLPPIPMTASFEPSAPMPLPGDPFAGLGPLEPAPGDAPHADAPLTGRTTKAQRKEAAAQKKAQQRATKERARAQAAAQKAARRRRGGGGAS